MGALERTRRYGRQALLRAIREILDSHDKPVLRATPIRDIRTRLIALTTRLENQVGDDCLAERLFLLVCKYGGHPGMMIGAAHG